jgi:NTE family protein
MASKIDTTRLVAYLVFQGGGAKGISHVGGLAAVNELKLTIGGVAGTSAGAIVAALVAGGYSAEEMFDGSANDHILKHVCDGQYADPTRLFTPKGWQSLQSLLEFSKALSAAWKWLVAGRIWQKLTVGAALFAMTFCLVPLGCWFPRIELLLGLIGASVVGVKVFRVYRGLCGLENVRTVVDEALRRKLNTDDGGITFERLKKSGCMPLKLVSTNVTDGALELFSYETTPKVIVADAVCASVCIPFVFKRWSFRYKRNGDTELTRRQFIDGGLMSNLPVWSFDEERALNNDAITIAFGLQEPDSKKGNTTWLASALDAVVAGPPQVHRREVNRLVHVPLRSPLGLFDFDQSFANYKRAVELARADAFALLDFEVTEVPDLVRNSLLNIRGTVEELVFKKYKTQRQGTSFLFRVAVAVQRPGSYSTLHVAYQVGDYEWGDRPVLSLEDSPVGLAWQQRDTSEPALEIFPENGDGTGKPFRDSHWMLSVPLPMVSGPADDPKKVALAAVLIIDSPRTLGPLEDNEADLEEFSSFLCENVIDYLKQINLSIYVRRSVSWL